MNSSDKDDFSMKSGSSHNSDVSNKKKKKKKNKNKNKSLDHSMDGISDKSFENPEEKRIIVDITSDNDVKSIKSEESKQSNKDQPRDNFDIDRIINQLLSV